MICEMCGADAEFKAIVEGTELNVCKNCSQYGKLVGKVKKEAPRKEQAKTIFKRPEKEIMQVIVPDYASVVRNKRQALGLKQKDFAKAIAEKESLVHKIETGSFEPGLDLARKLERFLKIKLVEQHEEVLTRESKKEDDVLTLGDFVKVKKR